MRLYNTCLLLPILLVTTHTALHGADWNQWRGPDANGVDADSRLPSSWAPDSSNVRWKALIPGEGHSQPVVSQGRIFVTTAYFGTTASALLGGLRLAVLVLAPIAALFAVLVCFDRGEERARQRLTVPPVFLHAVDVASSRLAWLGAICAFALVLMKDESPIRAWFFQPSLFSIRPVFWILGLMVLINLICWLCCQSPRQWIVSLVLLVLSCAILYVRPTSRYVFFLSTLLAFGSLLLIRKQSHTGAKNGFPQTVAWADQVLVAYLTCLFVVVSILATTLSPHFWRTVLDMDRAAFGDIRTYGIGIVGDIWVVTGTIAGLGLASAVGWFRRTSYLRVIGTILLLLFSAYLFFGAPENPYAKPPSMRKLVIAAAPSLFAGIWYLTCFGYLRRKLSGSNSHAPSGKPHSPIMASMLCILAVVFFVGPNFFQPMSGLLRVVLCIDADSGELLWETPVFAGPIEPKHIVNSHATPTPFADSEVVAVQFGAATACLDYKGRLLWRVIDPDYHRYSVYGAGSSPIVVDDKVIVFRDKEVPMRRPAHKIGPSTLTAYDKNSGDIVWEVSDEEWMNSYATPLVLRRDGRIAILIATCYRIAAHDVDSGQELWRQEHPMHQVGTTPVVSGDFLWIAAGAQHGGNKGARTMGFRLPDTMTDRGAEIAWESKRAVPTCASPVAYDGKLYTLTSYGELACYEATTGKLTWRERIGRGQWYSALLIAHGKLYASNDRGQTIVMNVGESNEVVSENDLGESIYAAPAIAGECVLIRTVNTLYCIGP